MEKGIREDFEGLNLCHSLAVQLYTGALNKNKHSHLASQPSEVDQFIRQVECAALHQSSISYVPSRKSLLREYNDREIMTASKEGTSFPSPSRYECSIMVSTPLKRTARDPQRTYYQIIIL